jgi:hypothetical protein
MLIVAWREIISGDSGLSLEMSKVLGSGCSLVRVSIVAMMRHVFRDLRQLWTHYRRNWLPRLLHRRLWLRLLNLLVLLLGHALVIAVLVVGLGLHAGQSV